MCRPLREQARSHSYLAFPGFASGCNPLWSEPARESGVSGDVDVECAGPFASKPAPTGYLAFPGFASGCNPCGSEPARESGVSGDMDVKCAAPSKQARSHRLLGVSGICVWLQSPVGRSLLAKAECQATWMLNVPAPSRASPLPQVTWRFRDLRLAAIPCGTSLLAKGECQATRMLNVPASSRAGSLPQVLCGVRFFGRGRPWP
ncbi:hypothetical protein PputUW4_01663 [Pseudomonas sp. UW4]|nr:hypothetical protein PputUW4_01663 [Pseudomonas sp. UW4]